MFDALSFAEIDGQHAELLPSRTVMSLFNAGGGGGHTTSGGCSASAGFDSGLVGVNALDLLNGVNIPILSNCSTVGG